MKTFSTLTLASVAFASLATAVVPNADPAKPPHQAQAGHGQYGYNDCQKYTDSKTSKCQTAHINSLNDFCLFAPPNVAKIGDSERYEVAWCTAAGHGARLMPKGTITGATMVRTPHYVQITGTGDFSKLNLAKGDVGGELDPHGYDTYGNPIGGMVVGPDAKGKLVNFVEWTQFIGETQFCIRACYPGSDARKYCQHIYDEMGCAWNMPGTYKKGKFESCKGADDEPMGLYVTHGTTSTWKQGTAPTPKAHPAAKSSQCVGQKTVPAASYPKTTAKAKAARRQVDEEEL